MRVLFTTLLLTSASLAPTAFAQAGTQIGEQAIAASADQEFCITVMSGFPDDSDIARYQFFRLTEEMAIDATPELRRAMDAFGEGNVDASTPILDVIETIANPVIRQAAPEIAISNMEHLIDFAGRCDSYLTGQIESLRALDPAMADSDTVIAEDALYLRQVLSDSLMRLGGASDPVHGFAVAQYAGSLVTMRDQIEYASYVSEVDELESLFMVDLDGRLARSNDMINEEIDREIVSDSMALAHSMNDDAEKRRKAGALQTLARILGAY